MVLSMTGYGKSEATLNGKVITVEIKSVNSRYFEYNSRLPRNYNFLDDKLKKLLNSCITRGKTELLLTVCDIESTDFIIEPNMEIAKGYFDAIEKLSEKFVLSNKLTADSLARFPDIFVVSKQGQDENQLWNDIKLVAQEAIDAFVKMRTVEGESLYSDIKNRLSMLKNMVVSVEHGSADRVVKYKERLYTRLKEVLESTNIDEARILTEAAIFADKTAVDEETVRLNSHLNQFESIMNSDGAVGRKLDFLTQEINREINTIGSKCNEILITQTVVDMKAEVEKIREQIQNIE